MTGPAYLLTPRARADLAAIWRHTAAQWSHDQADRYLDGLVAGFETLAAFPAIARERADFTPPVRLYPVGGHLVVYRTEAGQGVTILRILHMRQNLLAELDG